MEECDSRENRAERMKFTPHKGVQTNLYISNDSRDTHNIILMHNIKQFQTVTRTEVQIKPVSETL